MNHSFQNFKRFQNWLNCHDPKSMTKNEHVYAICSRPEEAGGVISGENAKTIEVYAALNFEVASSTNSRDIQQDSPQIVRLRPPTCLSIFELANFNANQLNIWVHLQLL